MLNPEQSLTEKSLHANFNEVQQAHFDKIMSELEVISGGFGFADLKEKAEAGSKEALQVMRDYITKKEEIVEFIETKEMKISPENEFVEITEMKEGDRVVVMTPEGDFQPGRIETVEPVKLLAKVFLDVFNSWHTFEMASLIKIAGPVESKYENTENVGIKVEDGQILGEQATSKEDVETDGETSEEDGEEPEETALLTE